MAHPHSDQPNESYENLSCSVNRKCRLRSLASSSRFATDGDDGFSRGPAYRPNGGTKHMTARGTSRAIIGAVLVVEIIGGMACSGSSTSPTSPPGSGPTGPAPACRTYATVDA